MITYKFIANDKAQNIKAMSLKKAMKSFQDDKAKEVTVEWVSKKGNVSFYSYSYHIKLEKKEKASCDI